MHRIAPKKEEVELPEEYKNLPEPMSETKSGTKLYKVKEFRLKDEPGKQSVEINVAQVSQIMGLIAVHIIKKPGQTNRVTVAYEIDEDLVKKQVEFMAKMEKKAKDDAEGIERTESGIVLLK